VPPQYERILYLDTDMYLERHDIARLFEIDLGGAVLAAVEDATLLMEMVRPDLLPDIPRKWRGPEGVRRYRAGLGLEDGVPYFNSGTMLIDRRAWSALGVRQRTLDFLEAEPERCFLADQSALNAVVAGRWVELSPRYNFQPIVAQAGLGPLFAPVIRHFCGPQKPWNSDAWPDDITGAYRTWLASSDWPGPYPPLTGPLPWADYKPPPKKRPRRSLLARLRRRFERRRGDEGAASPPRGQRAFAAALLAGFGEPAFVDFDEGARQAFRDAVARV
jgi:lipopolysaccharide biosynthesis glycosyltransferase